MFSNLYKATDIVAGIFVKFVIFAVFTISIIYTTWISYLLIANTDRKHEVCITEIYDGIDYMHTFTSGTRNTLDGIGYFCFGLDKNTGKVYAMRAKEQWVEENFPGGVSKDPNGMTITAVEFIGGKNLTNTLTDKWNTSPVVDANGEILPLGMKEGHFLLLDSDIALIFSLIVGIASLGMLVIELRSTISKIKGHDNEETEESDGPKKKRNMADLIPVLVAVGFMLSMAYFTSRFGFIH